MAILGVSFAVMGVVGGAYLWFSFQKARQYDLWEEQPAVVIVSAVDESGRSQHNKVMYRLEVHYRYDFQGDSYISSRVKQLPVVSKSRKKIEKWQERYRVKDKVSCFVNPADPSAAILVKPTKAAIYSIWFPGLIVLFGFRLIYTSLSYQAGKANE